jgi:hypothetical protein
MNGRTGRVVLKVVGALLCLTLVGVSVLLVPPPLPASEPAYTQHISVSMTGGVSLGDHSPYNVDPRGPDISADGRYVVWTSSAADLVPGGTTAYNKYDVFWRDRVAGITKRVSDSAAGANGNDTSWGGVVSGDGLYVAFLSKASNLVDGDTNGVQDAFVRNMATGAIERVSVSDAEEQSTGWAYGPLAIADDDYSVLFSTHSSNFGSSIAQVYLRDWQAGTTVMVSRAADGQPGTDSSFPDDITPDGRFVAFTSRASNITGETGGYDHIVVRELDTETNRIASLTNAGEKMEAHQASLSDDGRYVAFHGERRGGSAAGIQCWVRDIQESTTEQVSRSTGGAGANGQSQWPEISGDGRHVVFDSYATNLVDGDTNDFPDVFRYERTGDTWATGVTERMSLTTAGEQGPYTSGYARVSQDGQAVAFVGMGLIPEDNTGGQIYVRAFGELSLDTVSIEHDAAGVTFDRWVSGYNDSYSGGGYVYGRWTDTELRTSFVGRRVRWIGPKWPVYGMADVYIDDVLVAENVDCYAPDAREDAFSAVIWESATLADAAHTLSIRLLGSKNPASGGYYVVVDRFEVDGAASCGRRDALRRARRDDGRQLGLLGQPHLLRQDLLVLEVDQRNLQPHLLRHQGFLDRPSHHQLRHGRRLHRRGQGRHRRPVPREPGDTRLARGRLGVRCTLAGHAHLEIKASRHEEP